MLTFNIHPFIYINTPLPVHFQPTPWEFEQTNFIQFICLGGFWGGGGEGECWSFALISALINEQSIFAETCIVHAHKTIEHLMNAV